MAPSPRQQMYIQRLYLYLNMTKPSERLYLSYAKVNSDGKGIRPSYLIDTVRKLFPQLAVEYPQNRSRLEQIEGRQEGADIWRRNCGNMRTERCGKRNGRIFISCTVPMKQIRRAETV